MSFRVEIWHHIPKYRNGDLEEDDEYVYHTLPTRREAKELIENRLKKLKSVKREYHRGITPSYCFGFTSKKWINENTGEECYESYKFKLTRND